jgi:hypothetical protein
MSARRCSLPFASRLPGVAVAAALAAAAGCAAGLGDPLACNPVLVAMLFGLLIGNQPCIA